MIRFLLLSIVFLAGMAHSQKSMQQIYLKRSLKQDGFQYHFTVLADDKSGVRFYDKEKFYYWYKAQGIKSTQGQSSGILLNGLFEGFYENDQLYEKGKFQKGLKHGEWGTWRSNGTLISIEQWSNGKIKVRKSYDETGELSKTVRSSGKSFRGEDEGDTSIIQSKFFNSERHYYRNKDGQIQRVESRKQGNLHGKVKYYEDGKLDHVEKYKDGVESIKEEKPEKEQKEKKEKVDKPEKVEKQPKEKKPAKEEKVKKEKSLDELEKK